MKENLKFTKYSVFFSKDPEFGNPAAIIEADFELFNNGDKLQKIAKKFNFPVTVFLLKEGNNKIKDNNIKVRFFYPNKETTICVHGALAAACHLLTGNTGNSEAQIINKENEKFTLIKKNNLKMQEAFFIEFDSQEIQKKSLDVGVQTFNRDEIVKMLEITMNDIDPHLPFEVASAGSKKLLIPMKNLSTLKNLKPNFGSIAEWSLDNFVNGFYCYAAETEDPNAHFHARNFNPVSGQNEDIATGIAAAALGLSISKIHPLEQYIIEQWYCLGKSCTIFVSIEKNHMSIGGTAVLIG